MKKLYNVSERNRIVEDHLHCIDGVMKKNAKAIKAARLDPEDVYQQLALRLIEAVDSFSGEEDRLQAYILEQLQEELRACFKSGRMYGIMETPHSFGADNIIPFSAVYDRCVNAAA